MLNKTELTENEFKRVYSQHQPYTWQHHQCNQNTIRDLHDQRTKLGQLWKNMAAYSLHYIHFFTIVILQILVPGTVSDEAKTYLKKYHMLAKQVELQRKKNIIYSIHGNIQTLRKKCKIYQFQSSLFFLKKMKGRRSEVFWQGLPCTYCCNNDTINGQADL